MHESLQTEALGIFNRGLIKQEIYQIQINFLTRNRDKSGSVVCMQRLRATGWVVGAVPAPTSANLQQLPRFMQSSFRRRLQRATKLIPSSRPLININAAKGQPIETVLRVQQAETWPPAVKNADPSIQIISQRDLRQTTLEGRRPGSARWKRHREERRDAAA